MGDERWKSGLRFSTLRRSYQAADKFAHRDNSLAEPGNVRCTSREIVLDDIKERTNLCGRTSSDIVKLEFLLDMRSLESFGDV